MSFSETVKKEVLEVTDARCCRQAQLCGTLMSLLKEYKSGYRINIADKNVAQYIDKGCKKMFGLTPKRVSERTLTVDKVLFYKITESFGDRFIPKSHICEKECCKNAFLRGVFLGCAKINDPEKSYSLEFCFSNRPLREFVYLLLTEKGYEPKRAERNGYYVLYYRKSESIEDILVSMGALTSAFSLMQVKMEKQVINNSNRYKNFDIANINKQIAVAQEQTAMVRSLERAGLLGSLSEELRVVAFLRLNNPEASLTEIGKLCDPPLSKSSVQRRFVKIQEYLTVDCKE